MNDSRKLGLRLGTSSRLVLVWLLLLCLALGGITLASYRSQDDTSTDGRVAAFKVTVAHDDVDIESGTSGAGSWELDLLVNSDSKTRKFTVNNMSEVDVAVAIDGTSSGSYGLPNVTSSATREDPLEIPSGGSGTLTLTVKPATGSQMGSNSTLTQKGVFTFDIRQVN